MTNKLCLRTRESSTDLPGNFMKVLMWEQLCDDDYQVIEFTETELGEDTYSVDYFENHFKLLNRRQQ